MPDRFVLHLELFNKYLKKNVREIRKLVNFYEFIFISEPTLSKGMSFMFYKFPWL